MLPWWHEKYSLAHDPGFKYILCGPVIFKDPGFSHLHQPCLFAALATYQDLSLTFFWHGRKSVTCFHPWMKCWQQNHTARCGWSKMFVTEYPSPSESANSLSHATKFESCVRQLTHMGQFYYATTDSEIILCINLGSSSTPAVIHKRLAKWRLRNEDSNPSLGNIEQRPMRQCLQTGQLQ